jgi:hypothetical protein
MDEQFLMSDVGFGSKTAVLKGPTDGPVTLQDSP